MSFMLYHHIQIMTVFFPVFLLGSFKTLILPSVSIYFKYLNLFKFINLLKYILCQ